jgi:molybdenum cofactor biosynthesis enzyme MoaA
MDTIIIKPKNKNELTSFLELAKKLGTEIQTFDEYQDEQLLLIMEENRKTKKIEKHKVINTLNSILAEK